MRFMKPAFRSTCKRAFSYMRSLLTRFYRVGGTSIGSFVGGLYAREGDLVSTQGRAKRFSGRMASLWHILTDVTYPIVAYTTGHAMNRAIYKSFYDYHIEVRRGHTGPQLMLILLYRTCGLLFTVILRTSRILAWTSIRPALHGVSYELQ